MLSLVDPKAREELEAKTPVLKAAAQAAEAALAQEAFRNLNQSQAKKEKAAEEERKRKEASGDEAGQEPMGKKAKVDEIKKDQATNSSKKCTKVELCTKSSSKST